MPLPSLAVLMIPTAASGRDNPSDPTLDQLQRQRADVQSKKASKASEVNTLQASDAEVTSALQTLNANVSSQQDRVEEAERAVSQAEADQKAAEDAQAQAQAELDTIRNDLRQSAIETYMSAGSSDPASVGAEDVNEAVAMRTLMSMRANEGLDLAEQYRSKQEDLEIQRAAAADARERAKQHKATVDEKLKELKTAQDQQQAFAAQVEARLNSALAEADSLSQIDATLGGQISAKQAEIAKALAAQRAANAARAAARAAQNRTAGSRVEWWRRRRWRWWRRWRTVNQWCRTDRQRRWHPGQRLDRRQPSVAARSGVGRRHQLRWRWLPRPERPDRGP